MQVSTIPSLQSLSAQSLIRHAVRNPEVLSERSFVGRSFAPVQTDRTPSHTTIGSTPESIKNACLKSLLENIDLVETSDEETPLKDRLRFQLYKAIWSNSPRSDSRIVKFVKGLAAHPSHTAQYFLQAITHKDPKPPPKTVLRKWFCGHKAAENSATKMAIANVLSKLCKSQDKAKVKTLKGFTFDELKACLVSELSGLGILEGFERSPGQQYRLETNIDLAAQLLYIRLHGTDTNIVSAQPEYKTSNYVNNAFKRFLDARLRAHGSALETINYLSNLSLTKKNEGATQANCLSQQALRALPNTYAMLGKKYTEMDRVRTCTHWLHMMLEVKEVFSKSKHNTDVFKENFSARIKNSLITALHPNNHQRASQLQRDMDATLNGFCDQVKLLFPEMNERDIYRAKTNVWAIFVLQRLFQGKFEITPAAVGYSSLYPLTDSLIDDLSITKDIKKLFFSTFHEKIAKGTPDISTITAMDIPASIKSIFVDIWNAFELIEFQYDRHKNPQLYEAMRQLHMAQLHSKAQDFDLDFLTEALELHKLPVSVKDQEDLIFEVTARKGFLSILGDAFLVTGDKLSGPQASFAGHFGTITQFINDAMTVKEDILEEGHVTPHNLAWMQDNAERPPNNHRHFDQLTNQVFHYVNWVFDQPEHRVLFDDEESKFSFESIKSYLNMKLIMTVAKNRDYHSPQFLAHIQRFTPFSLDFLDKLNVMQEGRFDLKGGASGQKEALQALNDQIKMDLAYSLKHAAPLTKIQSAPIIGGLKRAKRNASAAN